MVAVECSRVGALQERKTKKSHIALKGLLDLCTVGLAVSCDVDGQSRGLLDPKFECSSYLSQVWQTHGHCEGQRSLAVITHALWGSHEVRPSFSILQQLAGIFLKGVRNGTAGGDIGA